MHLQKSRDLGIKLPDHRSIKVRIALFHLASRIGERVV